MYIYKKPKMAKHFNTWTTGGHNGLRDEYWKSWDLWRFPVPAEKRTAVDISKVPCGMYYKGLLYLNLMVRVDAPVDQERTRKAIMREFRELFGAKKNICVVDSQKIGGQQRWFILIQFYCRLTERPSEDIMLQVPQAAENGIVLWEPEKED